MAILKYTLVVFLMLVVPSTGFTQQVPDPNFQFKVVQPTFLPGKGPVIAIDNAHNNFHTRTGRYASFAKVLEDDGFKVIDNSEPFTPFSLEEYEILVISNAVSDDDTIEWVLPNPSAYSKSEIRSLVDWVEAGGKLFLIADHMPFPGASEDLAREFGYTFNNGFAFEENLSRGPSIFRKEDNNLVDNEFTNNISQVATFMGQGFQIPEDATPILLLDDRFISLMPKKAWDFNKRTTSQSLDGWCQGAVSEFGNGKLVIFGEAAMFSAQLAGKEKKPMGMNHPLAEDNAQLLLNLIRWLEK